MYNNKKENDITKNKTYCAISKGETDIKPNDARILNSKANTEKNRNALEHDKTSAIGEYSRRTTTSCTSSTDSGVNISDNDDEASLPSPTSTSTNLQFIPSEKNTVVNTSHKKCHKNSENTSQYNNTQVKKDSDSKRNKSIFNGDNDADYDDANDGNISENFDKKLKMITDCDKEGNTNRYQVNDNNIESKNVVNITEQPNLTALASNDKKSLQHNEFINLQQRPASPSLSILSESNSSDVNPHSTTIQHNYAGSPVVSIRSISSVVITSDSDSDLCSDTEGVHEKYVIKKLGTQVTYPPNDTNIPNINSGHTVLNQKVIPNDNQLPLEPLAALAAIGDSIGAAHALGSDLSRPAIPQRPQIGSIALNNSSDVTFGDKHFYEGPVTIQQFLIDSGDKWKETNGKDKPKSADGNVDISANNAKDTSINSSTEKSTNLYENILKRKKLVISGALAFMALLIVASVLASNTLNDSKSKLVVENSEESRNIIPINSTIDGSNNDDDDNMCEGNGTVCLIERDGWRAHPQKGNLDKQVLPLHRVVISHTASEPCHSIKICTYRIRVIQEFHMNSLGWDDIAYNFLISSDGRVYVGRGWDFVGAHTKGYNYDSVGITFIGTYISTAPTEVQLEACLSLLKEGVHLKKLAPNYRLYGARQLGSTQSPGDMLYNRIKKWQHWSADINLT